MRRLVEITPSTEPRFMNWWQVKILGHRWHHGAAGCKALLVSLFFRRLRTRLLVALIGAYLIVDDWEDRHEWFGRW